MKKCLPFITLSKKARKKMRELTLNDNEPRRRCSALTPSGKRCGGWPLQGEEFCLMHSQSAKAQEIRRQANKKKIGTFITRKELLKNLSRDFRSLVGKDDDASRRERSRLASLLNQLLAEQQQISKIKRLAKEKGLI